MRGVTRELGFCLRFTLGFGCPCFGCFGGFDGTM